MLAFQPVACFLVPESLLPFRPANDRKLAPEVLGVTGRAVAPLLRSIRDARMIAALRSHALPDLFVATYTLEAALAEAEGMAVGALSRAIERLMRRRQGTRGDLGCQGGRQDESEQDEEQNKRACAADEPTVRRRGSVSSKALWGQIRFRMVSQKACQPLSADRRSEHAACQSFRRPALAEGRLINVRRQFFTRRLG
jgi:hypothetical protein